MQQYYQSNMQSFWYLKENIQETRMGERNQVCHREKTLSSKLYLNEFRDPTGFLYRRKKCILAQWSARSVLSHAFISWSMYLLLLLPRLRQHNQWLHFLKSHDSFLQVELHWYFHTFNYFIYRAKDQKGTTKVGRCSVNQDCVANNILEFRISGQWKRDLMLTEY